MTINNEVAQASSLLTLLQLADSALPIGGYSHSWGFETWIQEEVIGDFAGALEAIGNLLTESIAPQDGIACGIAYNACLTKDFDRLQTLNQYLTASKWPSEIYQASTRLGQRLLRLAIETNFVPSLRGLAVESDFKTEFKTQADYHHAVVFGWLAACADVSQAAAVSAFLQNSTNCLISSCVRLIPLGHTDGQRMIVALRPKIAVLSQDCLDKNIDDMTAFAPMHEAACVAHETLYSRLFQS